MPSRFDPSGAVVGSVHFPWAHPRLLTLIPFGAFLTIIHYPLSIVNFLLPFSDSDIFLLFSSLFIRKLRLYYCSVFNLIHAVMKKLICVSLIKTIANCIADLMTLKQKLISIDADAPDLSSPNPNEYFIGNEKCAEHLGVSTSTVSRYASGGILKPVRAGQFACFKKSEVDEAVENVPLLKERVEAKESGKSFKRTPSMTFWCKPVKGNQVFIYLSYQEWHIVICHSDKIIGNNPAIEKLCWQVILLQHGIKPFRIAPRL